MKTATMAVIPHKIALDQWTEYMDRVKVAIEQMPPMLVDSQGIRSQVPSFTNEEIADVLERAVDFLESVGWIKGQEVSTDPETDRVIAACAIGAVRIGILGVDKVVSRWTGTRTAPGYGLSITPLMGRDKHLAQACIRLLDAWVAKDSALAHRCGFSIMNFNDGEAQEVGDVTQAFKEVIKDLRNAA